MEETRMKARRWGWRALIAAGAVIVTLSGGAAYANIFSSGQTTWEIYDNGSSYCVVNDASVKHIAYTVGVHGTSTRPITMGAQTDLPGATVETLPQVPPMTNASVIKTVDITIPPNITFPGNPDTGVKTSFSLTAFA